jgi:PAS domain S-box-containing protein
MALAIDKHQLLQDLRESQRKYSSFIEGANDGIMISQNGVFKFVNKKLADMLEYTVSDMIGLDITRTMAAEDVPILLDHYRKRVSGQVPKEIYQGRLASRTGKLVPVEFNAVTVEFDGQPASLSFVRDLSERLRLQNELRAEKEIAELYNDVLTHDVNNLLHTIIGNLDLMADVHAGELAPALDQQRQKAMANARRCAQLIDRVRDLMMIRHLNPASFVPVSLRQMLEEALDVVREQFRGTAFAAHVQAQANQYILGHQLAGQIFINLMSNAIRHNANKDKWVNVAVQDVPGDQRWAIAVEDNGNGIPDGQKDKVYDRLRRLSAKGGHGLGGSIVKALVSVLGGSIRVEDRVPGDHTQGTRFVVLLPKA